MDAVPTMIVLATDGSEDAALATRAALDLSGATGAKLYVAHAWRFVPPYADYPRVMWDNYAYLYEREARKLLGAQVDAIEDMGGAVAEARLLKNPPVDAILDLCDELEPDLLVMGSRGLGPVRRILVGSVSDGVVHHARCPVLVVRGEGSWPPKRVVVGDDGSEDAGRAGELAANIGRLFGADGVLVRAYQSPPEPIGGWSTEDRRKLDEVLFRQEGALELRAKGLQKILGSPPALRVIEGDAVAAILGVAGEEGERGTLVAVGSRGLGMIGRARLGSVSTKILRTAAGPVLVRPHSRAR
jgi:nucleotide-binding universal stress UspA family protein